MDSEQNPKIREEGRKRRFRTSWDSFTCASSKASTNLSLVMRPVLSSSMDRNASRTCCTACMYERAVSAVKRWWRIDGPSVAIPFCSKHDSLAVPEGTVVDDCTHGEAFVTDCVFELQQRLLTNIGESYPERSSGTLQVHCRTAASEYACVVRAPLQYSLSKIAMGGTSQVASGGEMLAFPPGSAAQIRGCRHLIPPSDHSHNSMVAVVIKGDSMNSTNFSYSSKSPDWCNHCTVL